MYIIYITRDEWILPDVGSTRRQLLTLAAWDEKSWLLRIGHQFGLGEEMGEIECLAVREVIMYVYRKIECLYIVCL